MAVEETFDMAAGSMWTFQRCGDLVRGEGGDIGHGRSRSPLDVATGGTLDMGGEGQPGCGDDRGRYRG